MKGTKGMQRKVILFLMFLFGISNNASSLDMRNSGAFFREASELPNVATLADMVFEAPNEAFLPESSEIISYEIASVEPDEEKEDSVILPEITVAMKEEIETPKIVPEKKENIVASLRSDDLVTPVPVKSRSLKKVEKKNDKFANIKVSEGEEVLVSTSEPAPVKKVTKLEKQVAKASTPTIKKESIKSKEADDSNIKQKDIAKVDDNPFGVIVSKTKKSNLAKKSDGIENAKENPFVKAFSAIKPDTKKTVKSSTFAKSSKKKKSSTIASSEILKKDLHKTYLSGNQYLSAYEDENEEALEEDVDAEIEENEEENEEEYQDDAGFEGQENVQDALEGEGDVVPSIEKVNVKSIEEKVKDVKKSVGAPSGPLKAGTREVLQMKIDFQDGSSAVSGESVNLIRSFAQIATEQPTNSIEITIPESVMNNPKKKKLTARRLSIVSNILRNAGISDRQILPVLTNRDEDSFAFRVVSNDVYTKLRVSKGADIFGEEENVKEYNIMKW